MSVRILGVMIVLFVLSFALGVNAEIPGQISFQGKLTNSAGGPIRDSLYQLTFQIYDSATGGSVVWEELDTLTTRAGLFQTMLGGVNAIPQSVFADTNAYLSIEFAGNELQPRKAFRSVGYAYHAAVADAAPPVPDADWAIDGDNIYHFNGNVGIGTATPAYDLDVAGDIRSTGNIYGSVNYAVNAGNADMVDGVHNGGLTADIWDGHNWGDTYPYSSNADMVDGVHNGGLTADIWDGHNWGDTYPYSSNTDMVDGIHGGSILRNDQSGTIDGNLGVGMSPDARLSVNAPSGVGASIRNSSSSSVALWVSNNSTGTAISCGNQTSGADYVLKVIGYNNVTTSNGMWVKGRTQIHGDFSASDGTKSAVVPSSQGPIKLYSQESPEVWFEDFGESQLINGQINIALDPLFIETVTIDDLHPMKVFIQLNDDCKGVYVQRGNTNFSVIELQNGISSARFSYRIVAKRKGYENSRLEHEEDWNQQ